MTERWSGPVPPAPHPVLVINPRSGGETWPTASTTPRPPLANTGLTA